MNIAFLTKKMLVIVTILCCSLVGCEMSKAPAVSNKYLMELSSLSVIEHQISPTYSPNISEFFLEVEPDEKSITLLATALEGATIEVNDKAFFSRQTYELNIGINIFYIRVASSVEMRGYSLTVIRKPYHGQLEVPL